MFDKLDSHLRAFREASPEHRVDMIREAYRRSGAERLEAFVTGYEAIHGVGSYAAYRLELERQEPPTIFSVAGPGPTWGMPRGGVWS